MMNRFGELGGAALLWAGLLLSGCCASGIRAEAPGDEPGFGGASESTGSAQPTTNPASDPALRNGAAPVSARGIDACSSAADAVPNWLVGCWRGHNGTQVTLERWQRDEAGSLRGQSETTRDGEVIHRESMTIGPFDGGYRFIASPQGQPTAVFSATTLGAGCVDFRNPGHDYPQLIGYRRNNDTLTAFIAGHKDGKHQQMIWKWQRIECD